MSSKFGLDSLFQKTTDRKTDNRITNLLGDGISFSPEGITSFMTYRYPIGKLTMFKGIERIPFGYELDNYLLKKQWSPRYSTSSVDIGSAIKEIETLLLRSIEKMVGDKKLGIVLSGGLDSSLLVAMVRKLWPHRAIRTYTAGFDGDNEFAYARKIAKLFDTVHFEKEFTREDYIGDSSMISQLIKFKGEPLHPNELALNYVEAQAAMDGCEIILCGEGADDLFGGYGKNFRMYLNFPGGNIEDFCRFFLDNYRYFSLVERKDFIRAEYLVDDVALTMNYLELEDFPCSIEDAAIYLTQKLHTPGLITRGLNAIKFNNLEGGFPYIDNDLVYYVNGLPFDFKIRWKNENSAKEAMGKRFQEISEEFDIPKFILKKIAENYLPDEIVYRKKYGFPVPFDLWLYDTKEWDFDNSVFLKNNISQLSGWKKFMLINLDFFIKTFTGGVS